MTPNDEDLVAITLKFCQDNQAVLRMCDAVVLERQMRRAFVIMNTVISTFFHGRVRVVTPLKVSNFFHLPSTRSAKKAATIALAIKNGLQFPPAPKNDDLADAWMMALYVLIDMQGLGKAAVNH